jgi:hypothetical protein
MMAGYLHRPHSENVPGLSAYAPLTFLTTHQSSARGCKTRKPLN